MFGGSARVGRTRSLVFCAGSGQVPDVRRAFVGALADVAVTASPARMRVLLERRQLRALTVRPI